MKFLTKFFLAFIAISCVIIFSTNAKPDPIAEQKKIERKACEDKWNINDTERNTALFIVRYQYMKMDQLSLAPTSVYDAISQLCYRK
jgi:hypothetical protein